MKCQENIGSELLLGIITTKLTTCSFTRNTYFVILTEIASTTNPDTTVFHAYPYIKVLLIFQRAYSLRQRMNMDEEVCVEEWETTV